MKQFKTIEELKLSFKNKYGFSLKSISRDELLLEIKDIQYQLECEITDECSLYANQVDKLLA
jgi:hypothetical protein